MEVNVHHAKTHLSKLLVAAEAGEEVIIARNGKPAVKLVVLASAEPKEPRQFGRLAGKLNLPANWEEQWKKMNEEIAFLMESGDDLDDPLTGIPDYTGTAFKHLSPKH